MKTYIALLRGINVGGSGVIAMTELRALCASIGFQHVRTYIQSGNIIFVSDQAPARLASELEHALFRRMLTPIAVIMRTVDELAAVLALNPFPQANPAQVGVLFFAAAVPPDLAKDIRYSGQEQVMISERELYIHYPDGMGRSKLKLPKIAQTGTMRNIHSIAKLVELGTPGAD